MQMSEENDSPEENGSGNAKIAEIFIVPKNKSHEERQTGMTGEKEIIAGRKYAQKPAGTINYGVSRKRANMSHADESGTDQNKKSNAL